MDRDWGWGTIGETRSLDADTDRVAHTVISGGSTSTPRNPRSPTRRRPPGSGLAAVLQAACRERVAGFKVPRDLVFVDERRRGGPQIVDR